MTLAHLPADVGPVSVNGSAVVIHDLTVSHAEAAAYVEAQLREHGADAATDMVRRALPVGLLALSAGTAGLDTGALTRTLDGFSEKLEEKSAAALAGLQAVMDRLATDEAALATSASAVVKALPQQLEAALAGEAGNVRAAVAEATRAIQAQGLHDLSAALDRHSESVRGALSLDREGPVRMLRQDLMQELAGTRRELAEQLTHVRGLVEAAQASRAAGAKSSRAVGAANEDEAMSLCESIVQAAGDLFERTGGQPGVGGTTRRTGDAVATLGSSITGHGPKVRLVIEAKSRTRPLSASSHAKEIENACRVRDAAGGLVVVPTDAEVPGDGSFCRVADFAYVVSAEQPGTVDLLYLLLREQVALLRIRQDDDAEIDLAHVEARFEAALAGIAQLDDVARLAVQAHKALEKLIALGRDTQHKVRVSLTEGIALLHP